MALKKALDDLQDIVTKTTDMKDLNHAMPRLEEIAELIEEKLASQKEHKSVSRASTLQSRGDCEKLKKSFKRWDVNNDNKLYFDEFFSILKQGQPDFDEGQAEKLFDTVDQDGNGDVDFDEFVDYVFKDKSIEEMVHAEPKNVREEDCRDLVMAMSLSKRQQVVKALKEDGREWAELSWQERLEEIRQLDRPTLESRKTVQLDGHIEPAHKAPLQSQKSMPLAPTKSAPAAAAPAAGGKKPHPMEAYTQAQLVDYSIHGSDLEFAGKQKEVIAELKAFKDYLKACDGPLASCDIERYLAKGTAGWVFSVNMKNGSGKRAMKAIRMTQGRTGLKEWYVSKILRNAGVQNIVYSEEDVKVLEKKTAPAIISDQLATAGPVQYFMCLYQEFMPYGSLEDHADEGKLTPKMMFKAMEDMAITLAEMHKHKCQHRDVKPENALVLMDGDKLVAAKLCDLGSAEVGDNPKGEDDDIRRFGVTLYALATGDNWMKQKLIKKSHDELSSNLKNHANIKGSSNQAFKELPAVFDAIVGNQMRMKDIATKMGELKNKA